MTVLGETKVHRRSSQRKSMRTRGVSMVEVLIGVAIVGLLVVVISHSLTLYFTASTKTLTQTQALYLAEEGQEILRYLRDADWTDISSLTNDTPYYLDVTDTTLAITSTPEVIDGTFLRRFEVSEVRRDNSTDDIVTSGGSVDTDARYVTFSVGWGTATVTVPALLTNIHGI